LHGSNPQKFKKSLPPVLGSDKPLGQPHSNGKSVDALLASWLQRRFTLRFHPHQQLLMKKKSASRSAFFTVRVLIGLFVVLAGVFVALLASGVLSATAQSVIQAMTKGKIITASTDPLVPVGFDCSRIHELGIDKAENFKAGAIMIACGEVPSAATSATSTLGPVGHFIKKVLMTLTRITPTRLWWLITIPAGEILIPLTSPAHQFPPTAARPSPG
jgi:hypothetical protein